MIESGEKKTSFNGTDFFYGEEQIPVILKCEEKGSICTQVVYFGDTH